MPQVPICYVPPPLQNFRQQNESELEKTLRDLLAHPEKMKAMGEAALSVVAENQGATKRNVDTFAKLAEKYKIDLMENTDEY